MKVGIATDHGGFTLKEEVKEYLESAGFSVTDYGAHTYEKTDDFPDYVLPLARGVAQGEVERGIAVCGSGVGASIAANKIKGVRAALITETYSAHQGVEHDELNLMCIGGRVIGIELAKELIDAFLGATYEGAERQQRRMQKIAAVEANWPQG